MTGPLAPLFAQVREGFLVASFNGLTGEQQATAEAGYAALSSIERHVQEMETAILRHVTQDGRVSAYESVEHLCNGKCPDEDMPDVRDPDCLACLAMDFTLAALPAREKGTECPAGHGSQCCGYPDECREAMEDGR